MRTLGSVLIALVLVVAWGSGAVAGDKPWFDLEKCSFCKSLTAQPGLLEHTAWEQYPITNGIVSVTTVDPEFVKAFEVAHAEMEKTGQRMMKGEQAYTCGSCTAMGAILMKGIHHENVMTSHGSVWIATSDSPEVVAELQGWAKRNGEEMAKMKSEPMKSKM